MSAAKSHRSVHKGLFCAQTWWRGSLFFVTTHQCGGSKTARHGSCVCKCGAERGFGDSFSVLAPNCGGWGGVTK